MGGTLHGILHPSPNGTRRVVAKLACVMLFLALSALHVASALACSCAGRASPCGAYASADAVFVGHVTKVLPEESGARENYDGEQTAYVQVEESFKGTGGVAEFVFRQPGHNCAPKFRPGERWILYATRHEKEKTWEVYGCGRSTLIDHAPDDLLYLRALPQAAKRTRISGVLEHYEDDPEKGFSLVRLLAGVKVRITGKTKSVEVLTNSNGVYEVYDLPPGVYNIEPEMPYGLRLYFSMMFAGPPDGPDKPHAVEVLEGECAGGDFVYNSDTVISGKVFGPRGEPLHNVCLKLKPLVEKPSPYFNGSACTEADGSYRLDRIPPGNYVIELNRDGALSGNQPFPTAYAPGVFERTRAVVFTVEPGSRLENNDIIIPRLLPTRTLRGQVVYADGQPVAEASVSFETEELNGRYVKTQYARTDEQGRFALKVLRETPGALAGSLYVYPSMFAAVDDCPVVSRLLKKNGDRMTARPTKTVKIETGGDVSDLKLSLPFPYCPLAPKDKK